MTEPTILATGAAGFVQLVRGARSRPALNAEFLPTGPVQFIENFFAARCQAEAICSRPLLDLRFGEVTECRDGVEAGGDATHGVEVLEQREV